MKVDRSAVERALGAVEEAGAALARAIEEADAEALARAVRARGERVAALAELLQQVQASGDPELRRRALEGCRRVEAQGQQLQSALEIFAAECRDALQKTRGVGQALRRYAALELDEAHFCRSG